MEAARSGIHRLCAQDVALHRAVLRLYSQVFDAPRDYESRPPGDSYLAAVLARDDFIELAALDAGEVVGALSAYILHKFEQERSEVYVYDVAVAEAHRRHGIATALIEALKPIARAAQAHVIIVQAEAGDAPAEALYSRFGDRLLVSSFDIAPVSLP
jgi:aminoglycoside 3-N-acetyltransferase I